MPSTPNDGRPRSRLIGYGSALLMVAATTWAAVLVDLIVDIPNLSLVFVLPVVVAAVSFGWGPALTAAVVSVIGYNFFLIEPRFTLRVADPANVWALGLLLLVAAIVSTLAAQSRRRALQALRHVEQAQTLQGLARALTAAADRDAITEAAAQALNLLFGAPAAVVLPDRPGPDRVTIWPQARLGEADRDAAHLAIASRRPVRAEAYPSETSRFDMWPVVSPSGRQAALGLALHDLGERPAAPERLVEIVGGLLAVSLDREAFARQALEARLEVESERVKADLLAAVSHDLRTPLSTILVTLQSLQRFGDSHDAQTRRELLATAEAETGRLSRLVGNLLDMSRIEAGAIAVQPEPTSVEALIMAAIERARPALGDRRVRVEGEARLPLRLDPSLTGTALVNVLENAGKYSAPMAAVTLRVAQDAGKAMIDVLDEGTGFPEPIEGLFAKFTRGVEGDGRPPGTGLGLAIARAFLRAQGGEIEAANRIDRTGGRVRITLPLAGEAPA
jgi:two-component system sensor histidine kinase KdpD